MSEMTDRLNAALEGRYRVERELGEGGMATVFLAEDLRHDRHVALKVLRPELAAVVGAERFLAEIKTTANLQHPHILPLFDSGEADSFLFYVMPYIEGESLREKLDREKQLRVEDAVSLTRKVADALDYAHEKGVVHRDIKPANILLSERGEPLVADFGIALAVSQAGGGRITETGLSLGTPHYMSPEQATGDRDVDPRSDVYALGCVLYETLAGQPPFAAPTAQGVLARILTEEPRQVTELRRTVPSHIAAVISRSLEKLPADRFESAAELREALEDEGFTHVIRTRPAVATAPTPEPAGTEPAGRRWAVPVLAAALAAALAVAGWGWLGRPDLPEVPVTRLSFQTGLAGFGRTVAISPDGTTIAWTGPGEAGQTLLMVRRSDDPTVRAIPGTEGARQPSFSPDGQWIVYTTPQGVQKVPVSGGTPLTLSADGYAAHWGHDGSIMVTLADGIGRVPEAGGEPELLLANGDSISYGRPWLLPNGRGVLVEIRAGGPETYAVGLLDLESGDLRVLAREGVNPRYLPTGHVAFGTMGQALFAVPFDLESMGTLGQPAPILENIAVYGGGAVQFDVSGTGTAIYSHVAATIGSLALASLDGQVEVLPLATGQLFTPRFSPDGRRLAYNLFPDIYVYDLVLGTNTRLTFEGQNYYPVWSPDGSYITFGSGREATDQDDVLQKPADGSRPAEILLTLPHENYPQSWSPDGTRLLIRDNHPSRGRDLLLATFREDGEPEVTPYVTGDWHETRPQISPDGRWVAYVSEETGQDEVFIRAFPEPGGKWQVSQGGGLDPVWAPDGSTLYYRNGPDFIAVRLQTDPTVMITESETLFSAPVRPQDWETMYDVHPDGDQIVFVQSGSMDEEQAIVVVTNWFDELRDRLGEER